MAGRNSVFLVATVCAMCAITSALAENVPLPTPAPQPKTGTAPASVINPPATTAPAPATSTQSGSLFPFTLPFGKGSEPSNTTAFDAKQQNLLDRISLYLSSVQTLVGTFVQIGPDGARTTGSFYVQKPGKVRFAYNSPSPIDVVADGSYVVVRNRDLDTQDLWRLSQTPLRYLLADHIDLLHDTNVVSVSADEKYATVVIEENQVMVGTSRLSIMFDAKDLTLKQWTVTDPQGLNTTVAVFNLDPTKKPDPDMFVINYQNNSGMTNH
jgi:outer membrane lipoprotein-sorting protein